jgi:hypothetical protein
MTVITKKQKEPLIGALGIAVAFTGLYVIIKALGFVLRLLDKR